MNGVIIINKPKGCTSHDIVQKVKKITGEKVGHTGTLDPLATGVLPILVGAGTKISKYLIEHDKTYEVVVQLGQKTATGDAEGKVIQAKEVPEWDTETIKNVLQARVGKQIQTPPMYSAIKVKGKKLYEYARKGQTVEIPQREIEIYSMILQSYCKETQQIAFTVACSKGTYIRSLCETIAEDLQTVGYMKELCRTQVGRFSIEQAITVEEVDTLENHVYSIEKLFQDYPRYTLPGNKQELFFNGVQLQVQLPEGVVCVYTEDGTFIGLATVKEQTLKRDVLI